MRKKTREEKEPDNGQHHSPGLSRQLPPDSMQKGGEASVSGGVKSTSVGGVPDVIVGGEASVSGGGEASVIRIEEDKEEEDKEEEHQQQPPAEIDEASRMHTTPLLMLVLFPIQLMNL